MKTPKIPNNEIERLKELKNYNILDTHEESSFDDLTILAAKICNTPIALISLIDSDRQWFKSRYGLDATETPRDYAFCGHAIHDSKIFEIEDSLQDERFKDNPLVTSGPKIRFYAGTPLTTSNGFNIGTLCVIDQNPRKLSQDQREALNALARQVVAQLELKKNQSLLSMSNKEMMAIRKSYLTIEFNLEGKILAINNNFEKLFGYNSNELIGKHHSIFIPYKLRKSKDYLNFWKSLINGEFKSGEFKRITKNESEIWIRGSYNPVYDDSGKVIKIIKTALDITNEKMKSTDEQQKLLSISNSSLVIEFDLEGKILSINDNYLKITGYKLEEIIGKHHAMLVPGRNANTSEYRLFWSLLTKGEHQSGEFERISKDNKSLFIRGSYNPIFDLNGTPYKIVQYALDITEDRIINENNSEILLAIDRSTSFVEFELTGKIISANDSFLRLMKYTRSEIIGEHHSIFVPEKDLNSDDYKTFWKNLNLGVYQSGDFLRINKFGKEVWIKGSYNPIFDIHGNPYKIIKYALDITKSKIAEQKIIKAEEELSDFINNASIGLVWIDPNGVILWANKYEINMLGYTKEEYIGQNISKFYVEKNDLAYVLDIFSTSQSLKEFQTKVFAKDGSIKTLSITSNPYSLNGELIHSRCFTLDITDKVLAFQNLKIEKEKATQADKTKSDFLYTMSHEIRTPLNGIIGMTAVLEETKLTSEQLECTETISNSGKTLLAIINDILDFSKIESGKMELEEIEFNFNHYVCGLIKIFQFTAKNKKITLDYLCNDYDHLIIGDEGKIGQIINNLISNALKFTKVGGVSINVSLKPNDQNTELLLTVSDTGIGIPDDAQARMFQAFSQAERSTSRQFGGTGLGLSISKRLVEMMGGTIGFESTYGKGTTFKVQIKFKTGKKITTDTVTDIVTDAVTDTVNNRSQGRILIAEDNTTNQLVLSRMLDKWGFKYHIVSNGNEVLDALRETDFQLILMDCQMPEMDGYAASKIIRTSESLNNLIPIIALTANAVKGDDKKCKDAGMNEYVSKPINKNELEKVIKKYFMTSTKKGG